MMIKKIMLKTIKIIILVILIWGLLNYINNLINPKQELNIFGFKFLIADYKCTDPKISKGDLIIAKISNEDNIKVGDCITFKQANKVMLRKVEATIQTSNGMKFITKEKNNKDVDNWELNISKIEGKYIFGIPKMGYIFKIVKNKIIMTIIIIIWIGIYIYKNYLMKKRKIRNSMARGRRAKDE